MRLILDFQVFISLAFIQGIKARLIRCLHLDVTFSFLFNKAPIVQLRFVLGN